jgi:hypothetical protein
MIGAIVNAPGLGVGAVISIFLSVCLCRIDIHTSRYRLCVREIESIQSNTIINIACI